MFRASDDSKKKKYSKNKKGKSKKQKDEQILKLERLRKTPSS
jgi:hypothetical protein